MDNEQISVGEPVHLRDASDKTVMWFIKPERVESMLNLIWDGKLSDKLLNLHEAKENCEKQIKSFNQEVLKLKEPTEYKVYISQKLYDAVNKLIEANSVWKEIQ